ncbi:retrotransposon protein, putative, ty1-copia subclass [Tanacetum coccineum]|uniref:Retrotransposon protein, putative, ty1-copia subclass n=1 Tax=Tanacetum coccineum TaxID=301880 RepID=A0ABQ5A487_9ASTR
MQLTLSLPLPSCFTRWSVPLCNKVGGQVDLSLINDKPRQKQFGLQGASSRKQNMTDPTLLNWKKGSSGYARMLWMKRLYCQSRAFGAPRGHLALLEDPAKDSICHECGETGHWKRNCPQYLAELLKKKKNAASGAGGGSGIFVIELNTFLNRSWIYDTGCGTHICNTTQGLRASRKLKPGALSLYVGNGQREAVEAIGNFDLSLPSGLVIVLNNCHYAPSITRGVISVSCLYEDGFINRFVNNTIQVSRNTAKKLDLDSALLWHCRLGHISKKRIEKLQHDGLLNSTDLRAFEKCVPCMSGKMARKPYTYQVERAKTVLGLIAPMDYCPSLLLLTSTQHNGVSERRNRTLLDMVRSMMSQTTLPKSFWDYALETAARILNMVPTKKVEKTPYEVWHGQAPKLSYLKVWGCEALVKRDTLTKPDKLEPRSIKCIFIGYPKETMGYSFYYPPENKVLVARNAEFLENNLIDQEASGSLEDLEIIQEEDTHPSIDTSLNHEEDDLEMDEPQSDIIPIRRSTRTRRPTDRMCLYIDAEEHELGDLGEPANYKAALLDPESDKWLNAMNVLIAIAAYYDYEIWQMDVKTTFLIGYLNEEV